MAQRIASSAVIYPNVVLGDDVVVEDFCIVGCPPRGAEPGEVETRVGSGAVIRSHTVIYAGNVIGEGFQTGNKANLRENNEIGDRVSIGTLSVVEHHVKIGHGVRIHTQVFVPEYTVLEDRCWLGPNVVVTNAKYPQSPGVKEQLLGAHVGRGAIVGANATLLPGVQLGERALVGAGSVVTRDVEAGGVWAGNPARQIKTLNELPYDID